MLLLWIFFSAATDMALYDTTSVVLMMVPSTYSANFSPERIST